MENKKYTNDLVHESSPYLLQHAHNPVNWKAWSSEVLLEAKVSNKLVLISVGYSACHWCHVMEQECFEDEAVAAIMNTYFVCIKIDREERPDIDQVYMSAVQLMTGHGGWPLNCFALPDGRPIYGGTYYPKKQWLNILESLADMYRNDSEKMLQYATELTAGIQKVDTPLIMEEQQLDVTLLNQAVDKWKRYLDYDLGGKASAPKFPLPNNYLFLLRHAYYTADEQIKRQVKTTLQAMAYGGIYDQIGGGFSRYSVDANWKVPHFEKMLYDNAQLITLYSEAYRYFKDEFYKTIVIETIQFLDTDFLSSVGAYYSAMDADSEGAEGKYYIWTKSELQSIIGAEEMPLFTLYYNVNEKGYWEDDQYILLKNKQDHFFAIENSLSIEELNKKISNWKSKLLQVRLKRVTPVKDDKILTSWNGLMIKALLDAFKATGDKKYLNSAIRTAEFITSYLQFDEVKLFHVFKSGKAYIHGFLEDYAFVIEAWIALYEITGNEFWLNHSLQMCTFTMEAFYDATSYSFYFTEKSQSDLIVRKRELNDHVIPASNSVMAKNLLYLSHYFGLSDWKAIALQMCLQFNEGLKSYLGTYTNYGLVLQHFIYPLKEVAIVGKAVDEKMNVLNAMYLPNCIFALCTHSDSTVPLCKDRYVEEKTFIYVCENNTCNLPTENLDVVLDLLSV